MLILIFEHWFYKYTLPILRHKPNGTVWKSPNVMFFSQVSFLTLRLTQQHYHDSLFTYLTSVYPSQKLYRFINCVELVSPHHAARELVHTLRQGQIASLFQKSIKRVSYSFRGDYEKRFRNHVNLFQKEDEQRRRRKSKAQFFEMIQEIRR